MTVMPLPTGEVVKAYCYLADTLRAAIDAAPEPTK